MPTPTPGRNDPCHCGSGKKYKRCCLQMDQEQSGAARAESAVAADDFTAALKEALQSREWESREQIEHFVEEFQANYNHHAHADFDGLTPEQMHAYLYRPFDSPELVQFAERCPVEPHGMLPDLARGILAALGDKGVKLTPKGNLPRALCRELAEANWTRVDTTELESPSEIRGEEDFRDLHAARVILELTSFVRKLHGRLLLTKRGASQFADGSMQEIYPELLRVAASKFNWGYRDRYPELRIVQKSFLFTLRSLQRRGDEWLDTQLYSDAFLRAFPGSVDESFEDPYITAQELVAGCYRLRTLERFACYCGLAEFDRPAIRRLRDRSMRIRKLPLLDEMVRFAS